MVSPPAQQLVLHVLQRVLSSHEKLAQLILRLLGHGPVRHRLVKASVQIVAQVSYRVRLRYRAHLFEQGVPVLLLAFGAVHQERFRFKIKDLVVVLTEGGRLLHVDSAARLQVFEVHVGVAQFFFALLEGALQVALVGRVVQFRVELGLREGGRWVVGTAFFLAFRH